jgi:preprotein translocase subunit YajC
MRSLNTIVSKKFNFYFIVARRENTRMKEIKRQQNAQINA